MSQLDIRIRDLWSVCSDARESVNVNSVSSSSSFDPIEPPVTLMYLCIPLRLLGLLLQCSGRHFVYWSLQRTLFLTLTLPLRFVTHTTIMPSCCGYVVLASQPAKQTLSSAVFAFCNLISPPFHPYRICHRAFIAPILYFHSAVYLVPTNQTTCQ